MLHIDDREGVRTLTLDRPEARNALNVATLLSLRTAVLEARGEAAVRCVILTGRGTAFCAGADVKEWAATAADPQREPAHDWVTEALGLVRDWAELPKPTVAMINGAAVGAGLDLALAADFRFAADTAKFVCSYTWVGYAPDAGGTWLLPRLIGVEAAKRFVFTGETWDAATAAARGLVSECHPTAELEAATRAFARRLAAGPTVAIGEAKRLIDAAAARDLPQQLEAEQRAGEVCAASEDHREGLAAANARRAPKFVGR